MALKGRVCTKGVWDESVPGITFDDNGISNYCRLYQRLESEYPRGEIGMKKWENIVKTIKSKSGKKKYDCIVGVSGGTDSSYLLYLLKRDGLNPLAVNLDNGWNSDISVKNIKKITNALNIDLETYVINYEEIKDLQRSFMMAGLPWIDSPTDSAIKAALYKIANREGIKFILRGNDFRTEGSQPKEWTYSDYRLLKHVHNKYGSVKLLTYPKYSIIMLLYFGFLKKIKSIYPYYYIDYNKKAAQEFLIKTFNWEYYGGHHHENIFTRFAIRFWLNKKFGIDKRKITFSALILKGELARNEAIRELQNEPFENEDENSLEYVCKKLDFSRDEFNCILNNKNHTYKDYPSYDFLYSRLLWMIKPVLSLIFIHKPQSLFQIEMRNKNN